MRFNRTRHLSWLMKKRVNGRQRVQFENRFQDLFSPPHSVQPVVNDGNFHCLSLPAV